MPAGPPFPAGGPQPGGGVMSGGSLMPAGPSFPAGGFQPGGVVTPWSSMGLPANMSAASPSGLWPSGTGPSLGTGGSTTSTVGIFVPPGGLWNKVAERALAAVANKAPVTPATFHYEAGGTPASTIVHMDLLGFVRLAFKDTVPFDLPATALITAPGSTFVSAATGVQYSLYQPRFGPGGAVALAMGRVREAIAMARARGLTIVVSGFTSELAARMCSGFPALHSTGTPPADLLPLAGYEVPDSVAAAGFLTPGAFTTHEQFDRTARALADPPRASVVSADALFGGTLPAPAEAMPLRAVLAAAGLAAAVNGQGAIPLADAKNSLIVAVASVLSQAHLDAWSDTFATLYQKGGPGTAPKWEAAVTGFAAQNADCLLGRCFLGPSTGASRDWQATPSHIPVVRGKPDTEQPPGAKRPRGTQDASGGAPSTNGGASGGSGGKPASGEKAAGPNRGREPSVILGSTAVKVMLNGHAEVRYRFETPTAIPGLYARGSATGIARILAAGGKLAADPPRWYADGGCALGDLFPAEATSMDCFLHGKVDHKSDTCREYKKGRHSAPPSQPAVAK